MLGTLGTQFRDPVSLDQVPQNLINAVIATEDRTFWTNDGIDLGAVFRAFLKNVTSGQIEQGGSTITQQLVKNRILTNKRTVNRKVKEIEDAIRLNEKFSKKKILEEYLNTIYLGVGLLRRQGRGRALLPTSRSASSRNGEAALLAGLISNPEGNNPFTYLDRAIRRRADVLRGEVEAGYLTQAEADAANNEPMPDGPPAGRAAARPTSSWPRCRTSSSPTRAWAPRVEGAHRQAAQGRPEDQHDLRPDDCRTQAEDATNNDKPQQGPRLDLLAGVDRPDDRAR